MLEDLRFRLRTLFRRHAAEDDLDDELRFHLERAAEQHEARGLSPREARRRARLEFGQVDAVKEDCRQNWGIRQLDVLHQDVVHALRLIRKHPALSAVAAISLAIGIGLNTALFALLDATILRRLPVDRPEQLVDVYTSDVDGFSWYGSSYPDYLDLRRGARTLAGLVGYVPAVGAVRIGDRTRATAGEAVTGNYFQVLGVPAVHGRVLLPDDDRPGATPVVVISSGLWANLYGGDPEVIGRSFRIGGRPYTVVGVAPEDFGGLTPPILTPAFWMPMAWVDDVQPTVMHNGSPAPGGARLESRGFRWLFVKGRLRDGNTAAGAADELNGVMQTLEAAFPDSNERLRVTVVPTGDVSTHPMFEDRLRAGALSLLVLIGLVLLIACANVAGLLLARAAARRREIGLRLAVGASRGRLLRQLLVESTVLALLGVAGGIALAWGLLEGLGAVRVSLLVPVALDLPLNGRVLAVSVVVAMAAGIAAGLMPAWTGTRASVLGELAGHVHTWSLGNRRWSLREALVALQIAVCLVLLVMAGLLARNLLVTNRIEPGFSTEGIASVTIALGLSGYDHDEADGFFERARERVRALPGVRAVARASRAPLSINFSRSAIESADAPAPDPPSLPVETVAVGEAYFDALGVPLLEGRPFDDAIDTAGSPRVAIVNEALARHSGPAGAPSAGVFARPAPTVTVPRSRSSASPANTRCASCRSRPPRTSISRRPRVAPTCCPLRCCSRAPRATRTRSAPRCRARCGRSIRTWSSWRGARCATTWRRSCFRRNCLPECSARRDSWPSGWPPSASTASSPTRSRDGRRRSGSAWRSARRTATCWGSLSARGPSWSGPARRWARYRRSLPPGRPPACCSASTRRTPWPGVERWSCWSPAASWRTPFRPCARFG